MDIFINGVCANLISIMVAVYSYLYLRNITNRPSRYFKLGVIIVVLSGIVGVVLAQLSWALSPELLNTDLGKYALSNLIGIFHAVGIVICVYSFKSASQNT